jgi:hypothetical protein
MRKKSKKQREKKKAKKKKSAINYLMIIFILYVKIHTHRVIERNEFFSRIDVDHDDAQNETCHHC